MGCSELYSRTGTFSQAERESNKGPPKEPKSRAHGLVQRFATLLGTNGHVFSLPGVSSSFTTDPQAVFRALDQDGSGELDSDEFERACIQLGLGWSRPMLRELMAAMDLDGNGLVSEAEFLGLCNEAVVVANGPNEPNAAAAAAAAAPRR